MKNKWGVDIEPMHLPSPREITEASYERAFWRCEEVRKRMLGTSGGQGTKDLIRHFTSRLRTDLGIDGEESCTNVEEELLHRLATAMAALSGLEEAVPMRSLLTADSRDRTIRVWTKSCSRSNPLSPPEVTKVAKSLGSGKLGRISICDDGSAVFDLPAKKAERFLNAAENQTEWLFEIPTILPVTRH